MTVRILTGDCRDVLATLPAESVNCVVTSPPYWGLRSYLPHNHPDKWREIGQEPTVQDWVETMVLVMREVRRVLRRDGTVWLNLGDSYAGARRGGHRSNTSTLAGTQPNHSMLPSRHQAFTAEQKDASLQGLIASRRRDNHPVPRSDMRMPGIKNKDMVGQPWRLAFALQDDGWWLRQEIIWHKPNPMPESCRDRCTTAHERIFLLSRRARYYYDHEAIQEPTTGNAHDRARKDRVKSDHKRQPDSQVNGLRAPGVSPKSVSRTPTGWDTGPGSHRGQAGRYRNNGVAFGHGYDKGTDGTDLRPDRAPGHRVKNNESFSAAVTETRPDRNKRSVWTIPTQGYPGAHYATFPEALAEPCILAGCPTGGVVLDPFGGSGTVGLVADRHHRNAILVDLDERNAPMAEKRIVDPVPLLAQVER